MDPSPLDFKSTTKSWIRYAKLNPIILRPDAATDFGMFVDKCWWTATALKHEAVTIMTSLNLFATKFDEVISVVESRANQLDYVLVDTPGQIEIFTWSVSGAIITEAFASTFSTVIAYVIDTPRSTSPATFMRNMIYACSILYKTRLPIVLWTEDFEAFNKVPESDQSYTSTLNRSLALALDDFYKNLKYVGVSAVSGAGMDGFFKAVEASAEEYMGTYKADSDKRIAEKKTLEEERRRANMEKLRKDMEKSGGETVNSFQALVLGDLG